MFTLIIGFIRSHWQTTLIVSAAFSIVTTISVERWEIRHLNSKLALCHAENVTLEDSNTALLASIQRQNQAINGLQVEAERKKQRARKSLMLARRHALAQSQIAARIEAQPVTKDDCADMRKLVNNFVEIRRH